MSTVGRRALLLVHLSSLDNYAEFSKDTTGVYDQAWRLAERIAKAVREFRGPVFIVDQGWEFLGEKNDEPRRWLWEELEERPDAQWMQFDEDLHDWDKFLPKLLKKLRRAKVTEVVMGGVWYDPTEGSGCVTATYIYLRQYMKAKVDARLVGCETDYGERGDPKFKYRR